MSQALSLLLEVNGEGGMGAYWNSLLPSGSPAVKGERASAACFGSLLDPRLLTQFLARRRLWVNLC